MKSSFVRNVVAIAGAATFSVACSTLNEDARSRGSFREAGGGQAIDTRPAPGLNTVYFDFDRAEIRSDAQPTLKQNAKAIDKEDWDMIVLEGHCDERGSEEYNLALGERRATSVKRYLTSLGVSSKSIRTVSYGESHPAKPGHDESAWRYNRRVEFGLPK